MDGGRPHDAVAGRTAPRDYRGKRRAGGRADYTRHVAARSASRAAPGAPAPRMLESALSPPRGSAMFHRSHTLAQADPERLGRHRRREPAAGRPHRADRVGELRQPGGAGGAGHAAHQQVRRGLSRQALLRRLRVRRRRRAARDRPREEAVRRRATPTCSRTPARRPTRRCSSPRSSPATRSSGMSLPHGGHLTHGSPVNMSAASGSTSSPTASIRETELIDYDAAERLAHEHKPKLIIAGASAYSRVIDWKRFRAIADDVGALLDGRHGALRRPDRRRRVSEPGAASPTSSPPPRTRRCAARAAASILMQRRAREGDQLRGVSRACRAGR